MDREDEAGWREKWASLELPPAPGAPPGFARRVALAWAAERRLTEAPMLAAGWMRAAAVAALLAGVALGVTLASSADSGAVEVETWQLTTLSEEYLTALLAPDDALTAADAALPSETVNP
jgi:hypothetical protein